MNKIYKNIISLFNKYIPDIIILATEISKIVNKIKYKQSLIININTMNREKI